MTIVINGKVYRELRCPKCRKLICLEYIFAGRIAFNCPRCGETSNFEFKHLPTKEIQDKMSSEFNMKGGEKVNG